MKRFTKPVVVTDTTFDDYRIVMAAADIAEHNKAPLKIVDVVPDFSWTVRLTLPDHEHVRELITQEKTEKLESLAVTIREKGVEVETKVLHGATSVEIIRELVRGDHDLVIRTAKGVDSRSEGFFGSTGIRLLRQCPCAVWLVTPERTQFMNVLACVDTSTDDQVNAMLNDEIFEAAKSISEYHGGRFTVVHAWSVWIEQMLKRRMAEESYQAMEQEKRDKAAERFDAFLRIHDCSLQSDHAKMIKGSTPDAIASYVRDKKIDLVVMGTIAKAGVSGLLVGNTAEQTFSRIGCSILGLKPNNLTCPIRLTDALSHSADL